MEKYNYYKFDEQTYVVYDVLLKQEFCVCTDYEGREDSESRAQLLVNVLNDKT